MPTIWLECPRCKRAKKVTRTNVDGEFVCVDGTNLRYPSGEETTAAPIWPEHEPTVMKKVDAPTLDYSHMARKLAEDIDRQIFNEILESGFKKE